MSEPWRNAPRNKQTHVQVISLQVVGAAHTAIQRAARRGILASLEIQRHASRVTQATGFDVGPEPIDGLPRLLPEQRLLRFLVQQVAVDAVHQIKALEKDGGRRNHPVVRCTRGRGYAIQERCCQPDSARSGRSRYKQNVLIWQGGMYVNCCCRTLLQNRSKSVGLYYPAT